MAFAFIGLCRNQVLLGAAVSPNGITTPSSDYSFGQVSQTWDYGGLFKEGDVVFFKTEDAIQLIISNETYFMLDEDKIKFAEYDLS